MKRWSEFIHLTVFFFKIAKQRLCTDFLAADPFDNLFGVIHAAKTMDLFLQPVGDVEDPSVFQNRIQISEILLDRFKIHAVINGAQQVGGEISKGAV